LNTDTQNNGQEVLSFDLQKKTLLVDLIDAEGVTHHYLLTELDGRERDNYLNGLSKRVTSGVNGKTKVSNFDGLQAALLVVCMREQLADGQTRKLKPEEVQAWPARVQTLLFEKAKAMSGLDDDAEDDAKND
jgi:hypothetical protein